MLDTTEKIKKDKQKFDWSKIKEIAQSEKFKRFGFNNQTIRVRLLLSFSIVIIFMSGLGIANFITFRSINNDIKDIVEEEFVIQQNYDKISYYMAQKISAVRGFLLTGRESYVIEFNNYKQWSAENEKIISDLDNSITNQNLFTSMATWDESVQSDIFDLVTEGDRAAAMLNMNGNVNPKGEQIISNLSGRATTKSAEIRLETNSLMKKITTSISTMIITIVVIIVLSVFVAVFFANHFSKAISKVVTRLKSIEEPTIISMKMASCESCQTFEWQTHWAIGSSRIQLVFGALYSPLVITGLHHMSNAIDLQLMSDFGGTQLWPMIALSNIAQGSAVLAIIFMHRGNKKEEQVSIPAMISCYLGVTEPAMFGINIKYIYPFIAAMIGSGIAGFVSVLSGVTAASIGVGGIPGFLSIQFEHWPMFFVSMAIAIVVPILLTIIFEKNNLFVPKGDVEDAPVIETSQK